MIRPNSTNLPLQLTSFIGREREIAEIKRLLSSTRLLTLTGAGGCGKTRLALQVAADLLDKFKDGVWFVELASLSDPTFVVNTVADVLGVRQESGRLLLETLMDWLGNRELLLVLDNCEHLIAACAQFADAGLHACPHLKILATSREPLSIVGENTYRVPSLAVPDPQHLPPIASLSQYDAVRLFIDRAISIQSTFAVNSHNASAVAQICHRLGGIPLAIELAAARVKIFSAEEIETRLDDRFQLLTSASHTAMPRQQTLRALIDWSFDLLSKPERMLLSRLSVFAGGWTFEAAETVCSDEFTESSEEHLVTENCLLSTDILDLLSHLIDKSLVLAEEQDGTTRYRMLETIRQYALEKLLDANEREQLRDQHLHFFLQMAERSQPILQTAQRTEWLSHLEVENDNLRAALEWACERDLETARWLAGILERFWFYGDHLSEAYTWYARVLNAGERAMVTKGLALALLSSGCVSLNLEYVDEAQLALESSVVLWRQLGEPHWLAYSLAWLAYLLVQRGERVRVRALYTENESLFRASLDKLVLMWVLSNWGVVNADMQHDDPTAKALLDEAVSIAHALQDPFAILLAYSSLGDWAVVQGDYATARRHFLESLVWRRKLGTRWITAAGLRQVANVMCLQGDYQQAEPVYTEALAMARALGDRHSEASIAQELAEVTIHRGEIQQAAILLAESLAAFRKWADALGIVRCLIGFVNLLQAQKDMKRATYLLGFIEAWLESNQLQLVIFDHTNYARSVAAARAQLDDATFTTAWEEGRTMTLEQAVEYALVQPIESSQSIASPQPHDPNALTPREIEVLRLAQAGLSDAKIAEKLVISPRTVNTHLSSIYSKLGVNSRSAATRYALDHKLI